MSTHPEPVFVSSDFENFFRSNVCLPFANPEQYHSEYCPIPWIQAFFGREGVEKVKTVELLAEKYKIDSQIVTVRLGHTIDALNHIIAAKRSTIVEPGIIGPVHLLIVDHADILCYEPDSEQAMLAAIQLSDLQNSNIMFVGLFDRLPGTGDKSRLTPYAQECQAKFWQQFVNMGYMPSPDAEFRISYMKHILNNFFTHMRVTTKRTFNFNLTDAEYTMLADCSTFATNDNIKVWLRHVFYDIIQHNDIKDIDFDFFEQHMKKSTGTPHICDIANYDPRQVENEFSTACGRGPVAKAKKNIVVTKPDADLNVTAFSADNVDTTKVAKRLAKNKNKKKRERGNDMKDDDDNDRPKAELKIDFAEPFVKAEQQDPLPVPDDRDMFAIKVSE